MHPMHNRIGPGISCRQKSQCVNRTSQAPPRVTGGAVKGGDYPTFDDVKNQALEKHGLYLDLQTLGPLYKVSCHLGDRSGVLLGESDGFVVPMARIMHCDTMRIYNSRMKSLRQSSTNLKLGFMGLGRVMAKSILAYGFSQGCLKAEILAINDDDETHRKLVMYYKRLGFRAVREVKGDSLSDVPHLLVWGGAGTRMDASIPSFLDSCNALRR